MRRPDFFIVGAPKCGTTAMYEYLRVHPEIFMPLHKEPLFFGRDLHARYGRMTESEYFALFRGAGAARRVGEASAWYLYSQTAASEIRAFAPDARIIAMFRNPVDVMHAQHSQLLYNLQEDISDFANALAAEPYRRRGEHLPRGPLRAENLFYRDMVRFASQLGRYLDEFGNERVHVIIYDDLKKDPETVYAQTLRFLGVDRTFRPDFSPKNVNKQVRSRRLQRLIYDPPGPLRRVLPWLRRFRAVHLLRMMVLDLNSDPNSREPLDPGLRARLTLELAAEVQALGLLIGRDLTDWSRLEGSPIGKA